MLSDLTCDQLNNRASNMLEAKMFFALKKVQELELTLEGVIPTKIGCDLVKNNLKAAKVNMTLYTLI